MVGINDIVITGIGCVTPIGIGYDSFRQSLINQQCAISRRITLSDAGRSTFYGASVDDFDGKRYVTPRKALKVMGREVQMSYSAAHLAWQHAGLTDITPAPDRIGVLYSSEMFPGEIEDLRGAILACREAGEMNPAQWGPTFAKHIFPLWMLKYLPNMPACHVGIAIDARGPNNTIAQNEAGGLLALGEAADIIRRGAADLMVVGACGSRVTPTRLIYRPPGIYDEHPHDEQTANDPRCIPFDVRRRGIVPSEGSVAMVIESRRHAVQRKANILAVVTGQSSRCGQPTRFLNGSRVALASAAADAMDQAGLTAQDLAHVSAQGFSEEHLDIEEAAAIAEVAPDVPVTAFSSYFGSAGAASGLFELAASIAAVRDRKTLPTLGFSQADPACPIHVCTTEQVAREENVLKLSFTPLGHAVAVVVQCIR